jgi:hypothetical protein
MSIDTPFSMDYALLKAWDLSYFSKWLEKYLLKNYKNHLRSNNYEVCIAVAHCFPNILDVCCP